MLFEGTILRNISLMEFVQEKTATVDQFEVEFLKILVLLKNAHIMTRDR